jgi:glycosyltransferase involved in cell wall biosynthesis
VGALKVVASTPLYPPESRVGAWLTTHDFLSHLAHLGHDVTVGPYMGGWTGTLDGVNVIKGPSIIDMIESADVVVSHCGDMGTAHKTAMRHGVPSVRLYHGGRPRGLEGAALVVFNSEAARLACPWTGRSVVCHPPTFPDRYETRPGRCVTLVNLSPEKGVRVLRHVARALPDVEFLGVTGHTGNQSRPKLDNVTVIGNTPDMRSVFARTRVLLMPSQAETWGRVGVEAMCSGIPVVAHPTPGLKESLGAAGVFVPRNRVGGWVAEIRRLLDPVEWVEASRRAKARVAELDPQTQLDRFADMIESL